MSDTGRQIGSIILLSIAGLLGVGLLYIILLYIKENYIKTKDTQKKNIDLGNHKNTKLVKFSSFFQKKLRLLLNKNRFKVFSFSIIIALIGWIVSMFADGWQFLIWGMIPIILIIAWIRSMMSDFDMSFGELVISGMLILITIFFAMFFSKNSLSEIGGYLLIALYFLKWPLIILAILGGLYGLVRFIKWAWKD